MADFFNSLLDARNWITCDNALRLDWLSLWGATGAPVKLRGYDLLNTPNDQAEIDFQNEEGETYICGNPPYKGAREQSEDQKSDLRLVFGSGSDGWKSLDYVSAWLMKAAEYGKCQPMTAAFVATNSICQGQHVPILWPRIFSTGQEIVFAHTSFRWANLASNNAGVTVVIVGLSAAKNGNRTIYEEDDSGLIRTYSAPNINPYLTSGENIIVGKEARSLSGLPDMGAGNYPGDGNFLTLSRKERDELLQRRPDLGRIVRPVVGAQEFIKGLTRYCLWIDDEWLAHAMSDKFIADRVNSVRSIRLESRDPSLNRLAVRSHQYRDRRESDHHSILVPTVSSANREFIPTDCRGAHYLTTNQALALFDAPLWCFAILSSKLHFAWALMVCGKLKTDLRYSNTLGWNTFPVPTLTEKNKADLTRCAENILLAREAHFPATMADLYDPEAMPDDLRRAHERNDETLERIYIGRTFRNDTERLEKLFELYTKMTGAKNKVH